MNDPPITLTLTRDELRDVILEVMIAVHTPGFMQDRLRVIVGKLQKADRDAPRAIHPNLYTEEEIARIFRVKAATVRGWVVAGKVPHFRSPEGRYYFDVEEVNEAQMRKARPGTYQADKLPVWFIEPKARRRKESIPQGDNA